MNKTINDITIEDVSQAAQENSERYIDHAKKVALFVDELLRETGVQPSDIDAIAVGKGPGSYTGLRIGVSFAAEKSLAQIKALAAAGCDTLVTADVNIL